MKFYRLNLTGSHRLVEAVAKVTGSKKKAKRLIDEGLVCVNGVKELFYRRELRKGSLVTFCLNPFLFAALPIRPVYSSGGVYVFNKPPFINSNRNPPHLEELVERRLGKRLKVVHRLDRQTSGLIIAVEEDSLFEAFKELFRKREVKKEYLLITPFSPKLERLRIRERLDGREAVTEVRVVERFKKGALLAARIPTGRRHQVRRHLSGAGLPISGEFLYFKGSFPFPFNFSPRILLHSYRLSFKNPATGEEVSLEAPLPSDFDGFIKFLKGKRLRVEDLTL